MFSIIIRVIIKTLVFAGLSIPIVVHARDNLEYVKSAVYDETGCPPHQQRLIFGGVFSYLYY